MTHQYHKALFELCLRASKAMLQHYRSTSLTVYQKSDKTPVTAADLAAHEVLMAGLSQIEDIPILSEEQADVPFSTRQSWSRYWLVDPLDGTREFIKQTDEFCICIAIIDNHQPVLGFLFSPTDQTCYTAVRGEGAFSYASSGHLTRLQASHWDTHQAIRLLGSHTFKAASVTEVLTAFTAVTMTKMGSALKFGLIAAGRADIYPRLGPTSEWDTAAGQCLLEEAGGAVVTMDGQPLRYNTKDSLLNPHFMAVGDLATFIQLRG